jgi:GT2 family glycosyltransferase
MTIHILTLAWNNKKELEKLYPTLKAATSIIPQDCFWFIRDNNSEDGTEELVESWNNPDFVQYYKMDNNKATFSKGNNFLIKKAEEDLVVDWDNDYILLCNSDITIDNDMSIRYMLDLFREDKVGMVGARLLYPKIPGKSHRLLQHAGVIFSPKYNYNPYHYRHQEVDDKWSQMNREFQAVTGAFVLIKASCWRDVKGLDERYVWCFEDVDLCLKIGGLGKRILYCGKTDITHYESLSLDKNKVNKKFMKHNVGMFKRLWNNKYNIDHYHYLQDPIYKVI